MSNKQVLSVNKLYKLKIQDYVSNTVPTGALLIKGSTVNIVVKGSQTLPVYTTDMVVLTEDAAITVVGAYSFAILPNYIYITGTLTGLELVGYLAEEVPNFQFES